MVGEVFLQIVRGLDGFSGDGPAFRAWVFTIAHHRLVDERRARSRRSVDATPTDELDALLPPTVVEPEVLERVSVEEVLELLGELTTDQREVLLLRLVAGLTTTEVAAVTGRDPEAVKGLAKRGLAALRQRLGPIGASSPPNDRLER